MRRAFLRLAFASSVLFAPSAFAHDTWSNGVAVPPWVKKACCGPQDVHHLSFEQVHAMSDGYHVDGLKQVIPYGKELPSQDGDYWGFWQIFDSGFETPVYCFFTPPRGV